jgi:hypothetical protein
MTITRLLVAAGAVGAVAALSACSVSVGVSSGDVVADQAYARAVEPPSLNLQAEVKNVVRACGGGSKPSLQQCYAFTGQSLATTQQLERLLRHISIPPGYGKANAELLRGLGVFAQGLAARQKSITDRSATEYNAADTLLQRGAEIQKAANAAYPRDAGITI